MEVLLVLIMVSVWVLSITNWSPSDYYHQAHNKGYELVSDLIIPSKIGIDLIIIKDSIFGKV